eukprot:1160887-Pelagomonas_calceolata.AAC.1
MDQHRQCIQQKLVVCKHEPDSSNLSSLRPVALCMLSALLAILDSPLCKAGKVKGIYVRTHKNVLIAISPKVCGRAQSGSPIQNFAAAAAAAAEGQGAGE